MRPLARSLINRKVGALLIMNAALILLVIWMTAGPAPSPPDIPLAVSMPVPLSGQRNEQVNLPAVHMLSEAAIRPLFNPSRQQIQRPVPAATQSPAPAKVFRLPVLLGVVGMGERKLALIRAPDEKDSRRLQIGDLYDGWIVAAIHGASIIFNNGGEQREVRLVAEQEPGAVKGVPGPQRR
jgi:hypothetical protein